MSRETSKEITLDDRRYKILAMSPFEGSWLVSNFQKLAPMLGITLKDDDGSAIEVPAITPEEFKTVQELCLGKIQLLTDDDLPAAPIYKGHEFTFPAKFLADDTMAVHKLTIASLAFGLDPFFTEAASKAASPTSSDTNQSPAQP
jgi:hypothetical protein